MTETIVEPKTAELTIKQAANLAVFDEVIVLMNKLEVENEKLIFDYKTPAGEKEARSHIAKIRKVKGQITAAHKEGKAGILEEGRKLDGRKNELITKAEKMIAVHKDPLDKIAAEKQAIIDAEEAKAAEEEAKRLAEIEAREQAVREAEEKLAKEKAEAERIEREKHIAAEAAEKAKAEAEAKAKAEADAKELAAKRAKEEAEAKERRRIANKKHREKIEGAIHFAFTENGFEFAEASDILSLLKENKIPHVSINY